jgi:isocitrate/isopropylmalate dehydrogenase
MSKRVAVVPGDDAAPEAVHATVAVLRSMDLPIDWVVLPDGETMARRLSSAEREHLIRDTVDGCDSVLFGATSGKTGGIGYLRWGKDTFANVRPVRWRPGFDSPLRDPGGIDYVIVRENLEDLYLGLEGDLAALAASGLPLRPELHLKSRNGKYAIKVITRKNTERVARFACRLARKRRQQGYPGKVTCAAKYNVLRQSDGLFRQTVETVVRSHEDLAYEEFIVDDFARRLVACPHDLDVVVLPNLYGDLLADEGAGTIGGLGLAPSGCYGDGFAYFEPVHGTAPDIAGSHTINPTATMLSAAMMLEYLGLAEEARRLEHAIEIVYGAGTCLTPDQGGAATTEQFADAVRAQLQEARP